MKNATKLREMGCDENHAKIVEKLGKNFKAIKIDNVGVGNKDEL